MASQVEIINKALVQLGAEPIDNVLSQSKHAVAANVVWKIARQDLLRQHPWNFAIARSDSLGRLLAGPETRYRYKYQMPSDLLRLLVVYQDADYKVEGKTILTDKETCYIKYVKDVTDTSMWDAAFTEIFSLRIKAELAYTVTRDRAIKKESMADYEFALRQAQYVDASEDIEDEIGQFDHELTSVRH